MIKLKYQSKEDCYSASTIGVIVSFYPDLDLCEVEIWDNDEYPIDVVTYKVNELEKI